MLTLRRKRKGETALARANRARDAGDWPLAARHYREVLARDPGNARIWVQYGHAVKEGGNLAEAETAYRKSLALDGQSADTHLQLGHVLKLQGRKEDAAVAYFRALALERPMSPAAGELLALCWEPIARLDADWRQYSPALLNGVASLNALAHEQERLARAVEELRREVDGLGGRPDRPARTNGETRPGALPERA